MEKLRRIVESSKFQNFITAVIAIMLSFSDLKLPKPS